MIRKHLTITKKGLPAIWESGGGLSNTGNARIIAGAKGEKLIPAYIRRSGSLSCNEHAMFLAERGQLIIEAYHHRGDFGITVSEIVKIVQEDGEYAAYLNVLYKYGMGEWDREPPEELKGAVKAAKAKALDYHCRTPYWIEEKTQKQA